MKAYSQDLRERVIAAVETGGQWRPEIAETFGVSESTIDKWTKRWRVVVGGLCKRVRLTFGPK